VGFCKHGNEHSYSIKDQYFLNGWATIKLSAMTQTDRHVQLVITASPYSGAPVFKLWPGNRLGFPQSRQEEFWRCRGLLQIIPRPLPRVAFKIHYSLIILLESPLSNLQISQHSKKHFASYWFCHFSEARDE
jgi:hypothetical protein